MRKKILENPTVKDALEIFDGEIEEIRTGSGFDFRKTEESHEGTGWDHETSPKVTSPTGPNPGGDGRKDH
jgi:hypothetical protein